MFTRAPVRVLIKLHTIFDILSLFVVSPITDNANSYNFGAKKSAVNNMQNALKTYSIRFLFVCLFVCLFVVLVLHLSISSELLPDYLSVMLFTFVLCHGGSD